MRDGVLMLKPWLGSRKNTRKLLTWKLCSFVERSLNLAINQFVLRKRIFGDCAKFWIKGILILATKQSNIRWNVLTVSLCLVLCWLLLWLQSLAPVHRHIMVKGIETKSQQNTAKHMHCVYSFGCGPAMSMLNIYGILLLRIAHNFVAFQLFSITYIFYRSIWKIDNTKLFTVPSGPFV